MKLVNSSRCLYKMTELEPNQYMNTEIVPISKYNINIIDFNYIDVLRTEIKEFSFQTLN